MLEVGDIGSDGELIYPVVNIDDGGARIFIHRRIGSDCEIISIANSDGEGPEFDWEDVHELYDSLTAIKAWKEGRTK